MRTAKIMLLTMLPIASIAAPLRADEFRLSVTIDLGKDIGQNFGSIFEAVDREGRVVAGAGFMGAYNSYYRADRHALHFYVRPPHTDDTVQVAPFPRPSEACHHYLFESLGSIFAADRAGKVYVYAHDKASQSGWNETDPAQAPVHTVGTRDLELHANRIVVDGRDAFVFDREKGSAGSYYYAQSTLFFHMAQANSPERRTFVYACPWDLDTQPSPALDDAAILELTAPGEFPYSYGQIGGYVIVGSNNGGIYRYRDRTWETLRPADPKTSFQLYAMINYRDRLLMGQYPSGELFEIVGDEVKQITGWPPRPEGATPSAREAQTIALYRGELYVGVWPWGEVWRLKSDEETWDYARRLFTQPEIRPEIGAPYEVEMNAIKAPVYNLWGQRVTALVPFQDALLASTSNKGGAAREEKFTFLAGDHWREYGAVHRLYLPGHLSIRSTWTGKPATFEFRIAAGGLSILQDGVVLGASALNPEDMRDFNIENVHWADGVYGPLQGTLSDEAFSPITTSEK